MRVILSNTKEIMCHFRENIGGSAEWKLTGEGDYASVCEGKTGWRIIRYASRLSQ
jgi:hypothetical protein